MYSFLCGMWAQWGIQPNWGGVQKCSTLGEGWCQGWAPTLFIIHPSIHPSLPTGAWEWRSVGVAICRGLLAVWPESEHVNGNSGSEGEGDGALARVSTHNQKERIPQRKRWYPRPCLEECPRRLFVSPSPSSDMALFVAASSSSLPSALSRLHFCSSNLPKNVAAFAFSHRATASFASSSVFGRRLVGSLVGFTLGNAASSTCVRGMEPVNAAAQVQSGSSIYDFVVKVWVSFFFSLLIEWVSLSWLNRILASCGSITFFRTPSFAFFVGVGWRRCCVLISVFSLSFSLFDCSVSWSCTTLVEYALVVWGRFRTSTFHVVKRIFGA